MKVGFNLGDVHLTSLFQAVTDKVTITANLTVALMRIDLEFLGLFDELVFVRIWPSIVTLY